MNNDIRSATSVSEPMILPVPDIAARVAEIERPAPTPFPSLVLLKPGSEWPPLFIAHGLGGSVMELFKLAKHIQLPYPVYGLEAKGNDGIGAPLNRIEDMAQFHLNAIKKLQPHGPYILIGYSLGGLVAFEMAQQLLANGDKVGLLAMLDSYPHMNHLSLTQCVRVAVRRAARRISYFSKKLSRAGATIHDRSFVGPSVSDARQRVRDSAHLALKRYEPRFYRGEIAFVRAAIGSVFPDDPAAVWGKLTSQLDIQTAPGDHFGMLDCHFGFLANIISGHVRKALRQQ